MQLSGMFNGYFIAHLQLSMAVKKMKIGHYLTITNKPVECIVTLMKSK